MSYIQEFLLAILTAIVLQNAAFTRGLGSSKSMLTFSNIKRILLFGSTLTLVTTLSALLAWPFNHLLRQNERSAGPLHLRYLIALASICIVYIALYLVTKYFMPMLHYHLRSIISAAAFNCAVLGSILIAFAENYSLLKTVGFALGSGIGYTAALLLIYEGRRRLLLSNIPRAFRGMPIMLLYIGILSLAIYGLIGHQLPT